MANGTRCTLKCLFAGGCDLDLQKSPRTLTARVITDGQYYPHFANEKTEKSETSSLKLAHFFTAETGFCDYLVNTMSKPWHFRHQALVFRQNQVKSGFAKVAELEFPDLAPSLSAGVTHHSHASNLIWFTIFLGLPLSSNARTTSVIFISSHLLLHPLCDSGLVRHMLSIYSCFKNSGTVIFKGIHAQH